MIPSDTCDKFRGGLGIPPRNMDRVDGVGGARAEIRCAPGLLASEASPIFTSHDPG